MILHKHKELLSPLVTLAAERFGIDKIYIEKDYWITLILKELSRSEYSDRAVFKGGTSLSKGYELISRFSEDVDIALCHTESQSGNSIKATIRSIEKSITEHLTEKKQDGLTSKGSRFRKSLYIYDSLFAKEYAPHGSVIVEINSFANPYPYKKIVIDNFLAKYLRLIGKEELIKEYDIEPFELNVLDKRQTLIEKLVSLVRFSQLGVAGISSKIRHFYDLHFLLQDDECREYVESPKFKEEFDAILAHDKEMFADPKGWQDVAIKDIPLFGETDRVWAELAPIYRSELSGLAFEKIPAEDSVIASFKIIADRIVR